MKGLTLIEVLIAAGISAIAGIMLLGILVNNTGIFYQQTSKVTQGVSSNDALAEFRNSSKEAKSVAVSYPETGTPTYNSGASQIVFKLSTIEASGNIVPNIYDYKVYYLSADKFKIKVIPDVQSKRKPLDKILAANVQSVLFEYFDSVGAAVSPSSAEKVRITLTQRQKAGAVFQTHTATSEANLRND